MAYREMMPWTCTREDGWAEIPCNGENELPVSITPGDPGVYGGPPDGWVQPTGPEIDIANDHEHEKLCSKCGLEISDEDWERATDKFLEDWEEPGPSSKYDYVDPEDD